jgi:hypothetical protein
MRRLATQEWVWLYAYTRSQLISQPSLPNLSPHPLAPDGPSDPHDPLVTPLAARREEVRDNGAMDVGVATCVRMLHHTHRPMSLSAATHVAAPTG